jgi:hypothetical protein
MIFKYKWSDKENGNFAIKKRNAKGIRIELKKDQQTSDTHYFILVNKNDTDSMYNAMRGLNIILETINFDYRQKGTNKKSGNPFLKKEDIVDVLDNIEQYRNKTIKIETALTEKFILKLELKELVKEWKSKLIEKFDDDKIGLNKINTILIENLKNEKELKLKNLEIKNQIKKLNEDIKKLNNKIIENEKTTQTKKENNERKVYSMIKDVIEDFNFSGNTNIEKFNNILNLLLYKLAKKQLQNEKASDRQKKYRDRKNQRSGIPKRKRGRPIKTNK